jgi:hypothetical protein
MSEGPSVKIAEPNRVARSYTQSLVGRPEAVFPLLCPVREADWIPGWDRSTDRRSSEEAVPDSALVTLEKKTKGDDACHRRSWP